MNKLFKTVFAIVSFASAVAVIIALYLQVQSKVPIVEIKNISSDKLTDLPNIEDLKAIYVFKNDTVKSLWKFHYIISNIGDENLIGEGNNKNIIKDNLKFTFNKGFKIIDYKLIKKDFPFDLKFNNKTFEISFLQWHPTEKFEITLYVEQMDKNKIPVLTSNEREIVNGEIVYSTIYKEIEKKESLFDRLPKILQTILWWFGIVFFGLFVALMPFIIIAEIPKVYKYKKWKNRDKWMYDDWISGLIKEDRLQEYRESKKLPNYLWSEYPYSKPEYPDNDFKSLFFGGLIGIVLFSIPLLLLINR